MLVLNEKKEKRRIQMLNENSSKPNWVTYKMMLHAINEDAADYIFHQFFPGRAISICTVQELKAHAGECRSVDKLLAYLENRKAS